MALETTPPALGVSPWTVAVWQSVEAAIPEGAAVADWKQARYCQLELLPKAKEVHLVTGVDVTGSFTHEARPWKKPPNWKQGPPSPCLVQVWPGRGAWLRRSMGRATIHLRARRVLGSTYPALLTP